MINLAVWVKFSMLHVDTGLIGDNAGSE
uniref:Uncharacterized protein n=1 Tax=Tetranychus urticae TaxID=32264 RepID=T1KKC6_TETUR